MFRSAAVTEQELTGAKKALIMSTEQRASNPASLGSFIGAAALSGGSVAISQTAAINSVTMGDVQVGGSMATTVSVVSDSKSKCVFFGKVSRVLDSGDFRVQQKFDSWVVGCINAPRRYQASHNLGA